MPRDLPPGGEDERPAKLAAHLQCHQRDAHKHGGSGVDQLVLDRVILPHEPRVGTCVVMYKLRMTSRANHWRGRAQEEAMGTRREREPGLWYSVADFIGVGGRRTYFFKSHWQYLVFLVS